MESTKVINLNEEGYQEVLMYQNQNPNRYINTPNTNNIGNNGVDSKILLN